MTDPARRLHHAASSYYSMIARLALAENRVAYTSVKIDIHRKMAQLDPSYARLNPNMTVPTFVDGDRVLTESRDIALFAFGLQESALDAATRRWLDAQYSFKVEELTFGWILGRNPLARFLVPRGMAKNEKRLRVLAAENADLAERYLRRADVFAARRKVFDPKAIAATYVERRKEALALLDALEAALADGREVLVPPAYGPADVVWTVFLARLHFIRHTDEIERRPSLARYARAMLARDSARAADLWTRLDLLRMVKETL
jgi:tetrachloro-p-hydroquinone reductive dehalogenase